MTYCNSFAAVAVTGLANGWNRGVDVTTLGITVPSDATYLVMEYRAGTGTAYGSGKFGDGTTTTYTAAGNAAIVKFVELSADKKIDLYLGNATTGATVAQWHCRAVLNHITPISPSSIGAFTGAGTKTIDCSGIVPSGAVNGSVLISFNLNMKVGALANITTQEFPNLTPDNHRWVPLDAARCFYVNSGGAAINAGDIKILGWAAPGCVSFATTFNKISAPSTLSTWDSAGFPVSTNALDFYQVHSTSGDTPRRGLRRNGDTTYTSTQTLTHRTGWVRPDDSGLIQAWRDNTAVSFVQMGSVVASTAAANIVSISTFVAGATATVVFDQVVTSITRLRATCAVLQPDGVTPIDTQYIDITSFSGSGTTWTFTVPSPTNGAAGIRLGAVKISPTTNTGVGADFTGKVYSLPNYTSVNIETPVAGNVCEGDVPALATFDQIAYDSTTGAVINVGGIYSDTPPVYSGTQTIWRYALTDFKWYSFTLTTTAGTTPDAFSFGSRTNVQLSTLTAGDQVTISGTAPGVDTAAVASGGLEYRWSTNGGVAFGAWTSANNNLRLGYVVEARVLSSSSYNTAVTGTLTVGGVAGTLTVTTRVSDTAPDNFSFESVTKVTPGAIIASPTTVVVAGVDAGLDVPTTASGGLEYRFDSGSGYNAWRTTGGNVRLGYSVQVRLQAPAIKNTEATGTLTMGGVSGTFTVKSWSSSSGGGSDDVVGTLALKMEPL